MSKNKNYREESKEAIDEKSESTPGVTVEDKLEEAPKVNNGAADSALDNKVTDASANVSEGAKSNNHQEPKSESKAPTIQHRNAEIPVSAVKTIAQRDTEMMAKLLSDYKNIAQAKVISPLQMEPMTKLFYAIIKFAAKSATPAVLDMIYKFFVEERNKFLAEDVVFRDIAKVNVDTRKVVEMFYTAFVCLVDSKRTGKKFPLDLAAVRHALGSDILSNFIAAKLSK